MRDVYFKRTNITSREANMLVGVPKCRLYQPQKRGANKCDADIKCDADVTLRLFLFG